MKITNYVKTSIYIVKEGEELILYNTKPKGESIEWKFGQEIEINLGFKYNK